MPRSRLENVVALARTPDGVGYDWVGPEFFAPELPARVRANRGAPSRATAT